MRKRFFSCKYIFRSFIFLIVFYEKLVFSDVYVEEKSDLVKMIKLIYFICNKYFEFLRVGRSIECFLKCFYRMICRS